MKRLTLKEALAGVVNPSGEIKSQTAVSKRIGVSPSVLSRLINYGEYPIKVGAEVCVDRLSEVLKLGGIDPDSVDFPPVSNRQPLNKGGRPAKDRNTSPEEEDLQLMQFDRATMNLFGLRANPFLNDVETDDDVYRSHGYDTVTTAIKDAINERGFLAVVAESGSGKTTIWDGVEAELANDDAVVLCKPQIKSRECLAPQHLAYALICGLQGESTRVPQNAEACGRLLSRCLRDARNGTVDRKVVLVIDDAHFCTASVLRQLKTFYEEKVGRFRLMSIILIGLPELKAKLAQFSEIGNRIRLVEVPPVPVKDYLEAKLRRAGSGIDKVFEPAAWEAFCDRFRAPRRPPFGRPLIINTTCIRAMVRASENGAQPGERITREIIDSLPGTPSMRRVA